MLNIAAPTFRLPAFSYDSLSKRAAQRSRGDVPSFLQEGTGEEASSLSRGDTFPSLP